MRVVIVAAPGIADIVARCASDNEVPDRSGWIARGFTNLKRILGSPLDFGVVVEGDDPTVGDGRLVGDRLAPGTRIHLVDDLVYSGKTLCAAVDALRRVDLVCMSASAILWTRRAEASQSELGACGPQQGACLVSQADMPE